MKNKWVTRVIPVWPIFCYAMPALFPENARWVNMPTNYHLVIRLRICSNKHFFGATQITPFPFTVK